MVVDVRMEREGEKEKGGDKGTKGGERPRGRGYRHRRDDGRGTGSWVQGGRGGTLWTGDGERDETSGEKEVDEEGRR